MAWGKPQSNADDEDGRNNRGKLAVPPPCPRCELTKGQMNRTIQNYQKAYRKKVEGLKQELGTVRADNQHLRAQVRRLRRKRLFSAPSVVVGAGLAVLTTRLVQLWQQRVQAKQSNDAAAAPESEPQADTT